MSCNFCSLTKTPCDRQDCPFTKVYGPYFYEDGISKKFIPDTEGKMILDTYRKKYYMAALLKGKNEDEMMKVHRSFMFGIEARQGYPLRGAEGVLTKLREGIVGLEKMIQPAGEDEAEDEAEEGDAEEGDAVAFIGPEAPSDTMNCNFCLLTSTICAGADCQYARLYDKNSTYMPANGVTELQRLLDCFTEQYLENVLMGGRDQPSLMRQIHDSLWAEVQGRVTDPINGLYGDVLHLTEIHNIRTAEAEAWIASVEERLEQGQQGQYAIIGDPAAGDANNIDY